MKTKTSETKLIAIPMLRAYREHIFLFLVGLSPLVLMGTLRYFSVLEFAELKTLDGRHNLFPMREVSQEITLIMIDGKSEAAIGALPWRYGEYYVMLNALASVNPRAVCLLVVFNREWEGTETLPSGNLFVIRPYYIPANYEGREIPIISTWSGLPGFVSEARGQSFSHMPFSKEDGIRRQTQMVVAESVSGDYNYSLELLAICHYFCLAPENISIAANFWYGKYLKLAMDGKIRLPIDSQGRMLVNFGGNINDFNHISFVDALDLFQADEPGIDLDLDKNSTTLGLNAKRAKTFKELFHNKLVLIGITADGTPRSPTPKGYQTALAMRANVINTLLTQNFIVRLSRKTDILYLAILMIIAAAMSVLIYKSDKGSVWLLLICLGLLALHLSFTLILFRLSHVWVDLTTPTLAILTSSVISSLYIGYLRLRNLISELKLTQKQLIQSEKEAVYGQMAKMVRHEIKNFLDSIRRPAEMVRNNFQKSDPFGMKEQPEKIVREMDTIIQRVMRLNDMVENELSFFQNKNYSFGMNNLADIINATLDILELTIPKYNIEVVVKIDQNLPPILADADKLQIAFMNLIKNACQAMPEGGRLSIEATSCADNRNEENSIVVIKFHDTGIGIRAEDTDKIFEPLFTTRARGFGVGLANAKNIVEAHEGEISVEKSEPSVGTTFKVTIPTPEAGSKKRS